MTLLRLARVLAGVGLLAALTLPAVSQDKSNPKPPADDEPLLLINQSQVIQTNGLRGWACCVSPDGKTLVTCAGNAEQPGEILVWDLKEGKVRHTIKHPSGVRSVAVAADNKTLAAGCYDKSLRLFDVETGKLLAVGNGHTGGVNGVVFTRDGQTLVTAGLDKTVKVWSRPASKGDAVVEFKPFASLEEHGNRVFSVAVTKDGQTILSGSEDRSVRIWDMPKPAADGKLVTVKKSRRVVTGHGNAVEAVAVAPDDRTFATGSWDATAKLWDLETGTEQRLFRSNTGSVLSVAFSPNGQTLIMGAGQSGRRNNPGDLGQFDVAEGDGSGIYTNVTSPIRCVAATPDGKSFVALSEDRSVRVTEFGESKAVRELKPRQDPGQEPQIVLALAWSKDGKTLAVAGENKGISLHDAAGKSVRSWMAHDDVIAALAFSPDGNRLASASHDGTVKLWNIAAWPAGQEKPPVEVLTGHTSWVFAVAFSSDGTKIASGGYDKSVRIWEVKGKPAPVAVIAGREGHSAGVRALFFMPGDRELVSAGADRTIRFWDAATGKERGLIRGHKGAIRAIALAPDGVTLASGSEDKSVKLWELKRTNGRIEGVEKGELTGQQDMVGTLAFSPRGRTLAVGTFNGTVHLWDPVIRRQRTAMGGSGQAVSVLAFSSDGQKLAAGGYDQSVRIWTARNPQASPFVTYGGHDQAVTAVALSSDGRWTATGDFNGTLRVFVRGGAQRFATPAHPGGVTSIAFAPDGQLVATVGKDKMLRLWKSETGEKVKEIAGHPGELLCVAWSPDGKQLATGGGDKIVAIWDATSGQNLKKLTGHVGEIRAVAFSPDGAFLASAGADRTFRIWDTKTWNVKHQSPANSNNGEFCALAYSPDGKTLALAHNQDQIITPDGELQQNQFRQVMLIDTNNGQPKPGSQQRFMHADIVTGVAFVDAETLVTSSNDREIRFWAVNDGRQIRTIQGHQAGINGLAIDPRTGQIATASDDHVAALWSGRFRQDGPRVSLTGQTGQVWFAEYSKDGALLATGGDDRIVRIRKANPGTQPFAFIGPFGAVFSLAVSPDGAMIASGHGDGTINLWDARNGKRLKTLTGHTEQVWSIVFLADSKRLVSSAGSWQRRAEQPGEAKLWDIDKGTVIRDYAGQAGGIYVAMPSPDGKTLATGSHDGTIRLWDLETGKPGHTMRPGTPVRTIAFLPDGKTLISAGHEDPNFIFWNVATGKDESRHTLPNASAHVNRLRVSPDGKTLALVTNVPPNEITPPAFPVTSVDADGVLRTQYQQSPQQTGTLLLWDIATKKIKGQSANTNRMLDGEFSPDGAVFATVGGIYSERGEINLWSTFNGNRLGELHGHKKWLEAVTFTKGGRLISGGGNNQPVQTPRFAPSVDAEVVAPPAVAAAPARQMQAGELRIWNIAGLRPEIELRGHTGYVSCGAFHPDGTMLATGSGDKTVIVWSLAQKRVLKHDDVVRAVRFSPDGTLLAASDESGKIKLWRPLTGELVRTIDAHDLPVYNLAFSQDGQSLATCAGNWRTNSHGEVKFWEVTSGRLKGELEQNPNPQARPRAIWSIAFMPNSSLVATAGQDGVRIYDSISGKRERRLSSEPTRNIAFSPDGKLLAVVQNTDADPTIRLVDTANLQLCATLQGHKAMVFSVRFSPDGKTLASASKDATALIWNVPQEKSATAKK